MNAKRKNGFTLIELLAVIAILAILVVIAVPSVLKLFNQGKDKIFYTQAQDIYKASKEQYVADQLLNSTASQSVTYTNDNDLLDMEIPNDIVYSITVTMDSSKNAVVTSYTISQGTSYTFTYEGDNLLISNIKKEEEK